MWNKESYDSQFKLHKDMRQKVKLDPNRLHYHIMPPTGWMNDPNGLCQVNGINHIYFQYTPYNTGWGTKIWGHYTTKDWITFQEEEPFLFPDQEEDRHGVYSGSAFIRDGQIHYFYTGNVKLEGQQYNNVTNGREQNTIHFTSKDGMNHSKKQLVMTNDDYPEDMTKHVRDPKIYESNGKTYMIMGARNLKDEGCALLFQSDDLENWKYYARIESNDLNGFMWECPDLFELGDQSILILSTQGGTSDKDRYEDIFHNGYYPVDMDMEKKEFHLGQFQYLDYGSDFYAAQSFEDEKGRRILVGWMGIPFADFNNDATVAYDWIHAMALPRELSFEDGLLYQQPIEEIHQLRLEHQEKEISNGVFFETENHVFEMDMQFSEDPETFVLQLREDVFLKYENGKLSLELNESGAKRQTKVIPIQNLEQVSIYSDTSSLEIFVNQGQKVMTTRLYSKHEPCKITLSTQGKGHIDFYPMGSYQFKFKDAE